MAEFDIRSLSKSFSNGDILKSLNLQVNQDSSLVILGGSGCGKSVLIKLMIGLITDYEGEIFYQGKEISSLSSTERKKMLHNCGYLFQSGALFDSLTIYENITFVAKKLYKLNASAAKDFALEKLRSVGLSEKVIDLYPSELSGGMKKRAALARTIATNPKLIFLDEPTTGLDPIMANTIGDLIHKIQDELNATTITITHDIQILYKIAKKVAFLNEKTIEWYGDIEDVKDTDNKMLREIVTNHRH